MNNDIRESVIDIAGEKSQWQSKTVIGALVVLAANVALLAGYQVDAASVTDLIVGLVSIFGALLSWYGRLKAIKPIARIS